MNDQQNMTSSKIGRAAKLVGTGAKIGGNYLKYYAKKSVLGKDDKEVDSYKSGEWTVVSTASLESTHNFADLFTLFY